MDVVWNSRAAEQIRADFESAMRRQMSNMRATADEYRRQADELELQALEQDRLSVSIMRPQQSIHEKGFVTTIMVPDAAARSTAAEAARELRAQAEELKQLARNLDLAVTELNNAIRVTNVLFSQMRGDILNIDRLGAAELNQAIRELDGFIRRMLGVSAGINDSFPLNLRDFTKQLGKMDSSTVQNNVMAMALAGKCTFTMFGGDPVNLSTGNFIYSKEDISIPGRFPLEFKRFYNSIGGTEGVLGANWTHNYNIYLHEEEESINIMFGDGHMESYGLIDDESYVSPLHSDNLLLKIEDGWELSTDTVEYYLFNKDGLLQGIEDINGNSTRFEYTDGLLGKVSNPCGSLSFEYNDKGRVSKVSGHMGREVTLEYTGSLLSKVIHPAGAEHKYEYDSYGNLSKISNPLGIDIINNGYDGQGRMIRQSFPDGGVYSLSYDDKVTTATEQNGNTIKYERDGKYRTTGIIYSDSDERFEYNELSKRTLHKDRNGNVRKFEYDKVGNLSKATDPLGNAATIEYNAYNKPTKIVTPNGGVITNEYDEYGNMTAVINPLGHAVTLKNDNRGFVTELMLPDGSTNSISYDDRGNILSVADNDGNETIYEYDELNRVIKATDPMGNETSFEYNDKGDISKVTNAEGNTRKYEYNANGKVTSITGFDGSVVSREYNEMGKACKLIDQEGNETTLEYDLMWNVSKQIDANGNTTAFEYDTLNRPETVTNAKGAQIRYEHDPNGNRTKVIGTKGEEVSLSYDALDRIKSVTEPDGAKTSVDYDCMGQVTKLVDSMRYETKFEYDKAGQKIKETDPSGRELKFSYTKLGQISEVTDSIGRKTKFEYLPGGLLSTATYPDGRSVKYKYDANKNVVSKTSQDGYTLNYEYDCLNQIIKIRSSTGQEKLHTYDAVGNVTTITDANGNMTKYKYSPNGNLTSVIDPLGNVSEYDYDKIGNLVEVKQFAELNEARDINEQNSKLRVTKYEWNELSQVERVVDALGNAETYTYDDAGNVTSKLDKDGFLTKYAYTLTNQLEEVVYADGKSVKLSYNPLKQLTEIKDWLGVTTIVVDELGRAKKVTDHNGREIEYTFGSEGERRSITYPDGKVAEYRYDDALRLKTLINGENTVEYSYDANSRLSDKIFSSGVSTKYSYNNMGMLSELAHSDKDGILDKYAYTYDNMVNKTGIDKYRRGLDTESGNHRFTYDALSRLTDVVKDENQVKTFGYDEFGNRSFMTDQSGRTNYRYNALNQLISTVDDAGVEQSYNYDKRGNLTQILENGAIKNTFEFSPLNRLTKATNATGQISRYDYNGLGFRVGMQVTDNAADALNPTKHITYILDQTKQYHNMLQMSDGADTQRYTWDGNVAFADGNAYLQDELGSPLRYVDSTGSTTDSYGYDEFGADLYGNQGTAQPFGYTGYTTDIIAGTYFAQAREYLPLTGRFIGVDIVKGNTIVPMTMNAYSYCWNNPLGFIDLNGLEPTPEDLEMELEGLTVFIDPGHGGNNYGARKTVIEHVPVFSWGQFSIYKSQFVTYKEKDINLDVSLMLRDILESHGVNVYMSRTTDIDVTNEQRVNLAIDSSADLFISVHHNSINPFKRGTEVYFPIVGRHGERAVESSQLAKMINNLVSANTGMIDRGVHEGDYFILNQFLDRSENTLAIITETGYMWGDLAFLMHSENLRSIAENIALGILAFYSEQIKFSVPKC